MGYVVLNDFMEKYHENTMYRKGDNYPADGFKADDKRVEFLQGVHHEYGVPFLDKQVEVEKVKQPKKTQQKTTTKSESEG